MTDKQPGGPAFPGTEDNGLNSGWSGMDLRDYFAAKAMQAFMSGHITHYGHDNYWPPAQLASEAYALADAMLEARK